MTFTLTLINRHGIWQSSDLRLTDPHTRDIIDDYSCKTVAIRCPDGSALVTYAGLGSVELAERVHLSDWLREFLRGETRSLDQTVQLIRQRATEDLGHVAVRNGLHHMFVIGAFLRGVPWIVQIRNFSVTPKVSYGPPTADFQVVPMRAPEHGLFCVWPWLLPRKDRELLERIAHGKPRRPSDFCHRLAAINLRVSRNDGEKSRVSPHCVTSYLLPPDGHPQTEFHRFPPGAPKVETPLLLLGIDLHELVRDGDRLSMRYTGQLAPPKHSGPPQALTPRNRLKKKS